VYLVDNGSTDGSMDRLELEFAAAASCGFANRPTSGSRPAAIPASSGRSRRLPLRAAAQQRLHARRARSARRRVALAESNPRCGIVGGKVLGWPDTTRILGVGGRIGWHTTPFRRHRRGGPRTATPSPETGYVSGR